MFRFNLKKPETFVNILVAFISNVAFTNEIIIAIITSSVNIAVVNHDLTFVDINTRETITQITRTTHTTVCPDSINAIITDVIMMTKFFAFIHIHTLICIIST